MSRPRTPRRELTDLQRRGRRTHRVVIAVATIAGVVFATPFVVVGLMITGVITLVDTDPNAACSRGSVLARSSAEGNLDDVRRLLDGGVDPNERNTEANTALGCAVPRGQTDVVALLLERGADPNQDTGEGTYMEVPLGLAVRRGQPTAARLLLERGADPNRVDCRGVPFAALLESLVAPGAPPVASGGPPEVSDLELVELMLARGADVKGRPGPVDGDQVPLAIALRKARPDVVRALMARGADVTGADGALVLELAVATRSTELLDAALRNGASPDGIIARRPLVAAAIVGDLAALDRLVAAGARVDLPYSDANPTRTIDVALELAVSADVRARLITHGADPLRATQALNLVVARKDVAALAPLIASGASSNEGSVSLDVLVGLSWQRVLGDGWLQDRTAVRVNRWSPWSTSEVVLEHLGTEAGTPLSARQLSVAASSGSSVPASTSTTTARLPRSVDPRLVRCGQPMGMTITAPPSWPSETSDELRRNPISAASLTSRRVSVTPITMALLVRNNDALQVLLDLGVDPDGASVDGRRPLALAVEDGNDIGAQLLRDRGAT